MPIYIVTYDHPNETGWQAHVMLHVTWLQERLKDGSLLASGPFVGEAAKSALLVIAADGRAALDALIATDPFAQEGLIENMTVREWDPIFGAFNALSTMAGRLQGD